MAAIALVLLACCGGGKSDSEEVADAVRGYLSAAADRDGERACGFLTRRAQLSAFEFGRVHAAPDHPDEACASVFKGYHPLTGVARLRRASVSAVRVEGERAQARAGRVAVRLRKEDGEWKLDVAGIADQIRNAAPVGDRGEPPGAIA